MSVKWYVLRRQSASKPVLPASFSALGICRLENWGYCEDSGWDRLAQSERSSASYWEDGLQAMRSAGAGRAQLCVLLGGRTSGKAVGWRRASAALRLTGRTDFRQGGRLAQGERSSASYWEDGLQARRSAGAGRAQLCVLLGGRTSGKAVGWRRASAALRLTGRTDFRQGGRLAPGERS